MNLYCISAMRSAVIRSSLIKNKALLFPVRDSVDMPERFDSVLGESVMRCEHIFDIRQHKFRSQLIERSDIQAAVKIMPSETLAEHFRELVVSILFQYGFC